MAFGDCDEEGSGQVFRGPPEPSDLGKFVMPRRRTSAGKNGRPDRILFGFGPGCLAAGQGAGVAMSTPKILALREIEPPPVLAEALTAEFLAPLRIENLPPLRLAKLEEWAGYCPSTKASEVGEVVVSTAPRPAGDIEWFRMIYLHEITHKFLSIYSEDEIGGSHGPAFFALELLFFSRASGQQQWTWWADLYDLQDAWGNNDYTPGQALDWAWQQAQELAPADISAEASAQEIVRRCAVWRASCAAAPARRAAAREARAALARKISLAQWWACYFGVLGLLVGFGWGFWAA